MKAVQITEPGDPQVLMWSEAATPVPGAGEVLIDVTATAVNRADLLQRQGLYPPPPGATEILGLECSGRIAQLGPGVKAPTVGTPVVALLAGGGYAEQVAVPVGQVMSVPDGVDLVSAAGLPEVSCTVYSNLVMEARLAEGEWVLIHGAGSGVGTMAIQVARALGARVAVTAGSEEKLSLCAELGAEVLINYRDQDFEEVIEAATSGRGVDVILDNMGASYLQRNINVLARNGRLVIIGMQGGVKAEINIATLLQRNGRIISTSLRGRPLDEKAAICDAVERTIWPWIHAGIIKPVIDRVISLPDAAWAHEALEQGNVTGKIVLQTP